MTNASKRLYAFRVQGRGPIVKWDRETVLDELIDQREATPQSDTAARVRLAIDATERFAELNGFVYTFSSGGPGHSYRQYFDMPKAPAVVIHTDQVFECSNPIFFHRQALLFAGAIVDLLPRSWLDPGLAAYVFRPYPES